MRLIAALCLATTAAFAQTQPEIITSDIDHFWQAYDSSQPGNREDAFQKFYLNAGSAGLQDFLKLRISSAKALADAVDRQYPKFYGSVRPYTLQVEKQRPTILKYLARYKEMYPEAHFPPVYFVVGRLTSGGTTSSRGLLIGTEVNSVGSGVVTSEINPVFRKAMGDAERIPLIVVHELTHTQTRPFPKGKLPPLIANCLMEGAADFMTELVTGSSINAYMKEWADARRDELFARFARDVAAKPGASGAWLYNYDTVKDEPADLGYWIGAEICRDYYGRTENKTAAISAIVSQEYPETIVRNSRYAYLLAPEQ